MHIIWIIVSLILTLIYFVIIQQYLSNWQQLQTWNIPKNFISRRSITVIIPIRNEEENIVACLHSILRNDYPDHLLEIIVIDDHSEDGSVKLIKEIASPKVKIIDLRLFEKPDTFGSYKKWGIEKAIEIAQGDLILCTDGDCIVPNEWLKFFASYSTINEKEFITAPVNFHVGNNRLQNFQELDMMGVMIMTGAGIQKRKGLLCNGANLGFTKTLFNKIEGYKGIEKLASGDDVFLLQKVAQKYPEKIGFIKNRNCTVLTKSMKDWKSFFKQRIRWATKTSSYDDKYLKTNIVLIYLFHFSILINLILLINYPLLGLALLAFGLLVKLFSDHRILSRAVHFFKGGKGVPGFMSAVGIQTFYLISIGFISLIKKEYEWKGRKSI